MTTGRRQGAREGFTLIELLIGAVITAVLLAALHGVFQSLLQGQSRAYARLEESSPRAQAVAVIRKDLENMVVPNGVLCGNVLGLSDGEGGGRADSLEFNTTSGRVSDAKPWGEVQKVAYHLGTSEVPEADSGVQLIRSVTRNLLSTDAEDQQEEMPLLDRVQSRAFEYYDGQIWSEIWDSTVLENAPPKAIRVMITFVSDETGKTVPPAPLEIVCEVAVQKTTAAAASPANAPAK